MFKKIQKIFKHNAVIIISMVLLLLATVYTSYAASYKLSVNSDAVVAPYLFENGSIDGSAFLGAHTNLIKFPIFFAQSLLPYNIHTYNVVNVSLAILTVLLVVLCYYALFKRKYLALFSLLLTSILLTSPALNIVITSTTIRNIEYPISILFIFIIACILLNKINSRKGKVLAGIGVLIYSIMVAGDSFFTYTVSTSALLVVAVLYFKNLSLKPTKRIIYAFCVILASTVLSYILRLLLTLTGASLHTGSDLGLNIVTKEDFWLSISETFFHTFILFGGNVFGQTVSMSNSIIFVNFLITIFAFTGIVLTFLNTVVYSKSKTHTFTSLSLGMISTWSLLAPVVFIVSGLAIIHTGNGTIEVVVRYISVIPFIWLFGIPYLIDRIHKNFRTVAILLFMACIVTALFVGVQHIRTLNTKSPQYDYVAYLNRIDTVAKANDINVVIAGYWQGPTLRMHSDSRIKYASVIDCTRPYPPINNRLSMYSTDKGEARSALLVIKNGLGSEAWSCSDKDLNEFYGQPTKIVKLAHAKSGESSELWIYNKDLRRSLDLNEVLKTFGR